MKLYIEVCYVIFVTKTMLMIGHMHRRMLLSFMIPKAYGNYFHAQVYKTSHELYTRFAFSMARIQSILSNLSSQHDKIKAQHGSLPMGMSQYSCYKYRYQTSPTALSFG